jgi:hypothetical protein
MICAAYDETQDVRQAAEGGRFGSTGDGLPLWRKGRAIKVLDWLLWFLVPIGLFLVLLVILGLKFLRDLERNERERGDDH